MKMTPLRLAVPVVLILLGLGASPAVSSSPRSTPPWKGRTPARAWGTPTRKCRSGSTVPTGPTSTAILGTPTYITPDGSRAAYGWRVLNGWWIGLCNQAQIENRVLFLAFDPDGVLRGYKLEKSGGSLMNPDQPLMTPHGFIPFPGFSLFSPNPNPPATQPAGR